MFVLPGASQDRKDSFQVTYLFLKSLVKVSGIL